MKVLYITTALFDTYDAPPYHVIGFCEGLKQNGCEVTLLRPASNLTSLNSLTDEFINISVPRLSIRGSWLIFQMMFTLRLRQLISQGHYDFIYLRVSPNKPFLQVLKNSPIPKALELNGLRGNDSDIFRNYSNIFSVVFTDSSTLIEKVSQNWNLPKSRFRLLPNCGISSSLYARLPPRKTSVRMNLNMDPDVFTIGHVSSFRPHHDFDTLFYALQQIKFPFQVMFIGNGLRFQEIRKKYKTLGQGIYFLGGLSQAKSLSALKASDVCINLYPKTALINGNNRSFKLYEYMGVGVPTIDTIDPHLFVSEWARRFLALAVSEDYKSVADKIREVYYNLPEWQERANQAQEWVIANYSWEKITRQALYAMQMSTGETICHD